MSTRRPHPSLGLQPTPTRVWPAVALLILLGAIVYARSFSIPFLFDDTPAIVENPAIRSFATALAPGQPGGLTTSGRPVLALSFALNHAASGYAVGSYHAVNLAIHLAAALALFGLVRRTLLGASGLCSKPLASAALPLATATAALWLLHPLQTESVAYIVQRAESLVGLFCLFTLYAFARGTAGDCRWLGLSVIACALGMGSKEVMAGVPLLVLLYDRTFVAGSFAAAWRARKAWYLAYAATWLILLALLVSGSDRGGTAGFGTQMSSWHYALTQCHALVRYLCLSVWPWSLVFDYGTGAARSLGEVLPQALLVVALLAGTVVALRRWPVTGFLAAWCFILLAPSSSFVPVVTQTMAEHRMYLPLAALVAAGVVGAHAALGRRAWPLLGVVAVALGATTVARLGDYRDELSIWGDTAAKHPSSARAHNNYGQALFRAGRLDEAVASYERALAIQPKYPETHYNLGVARMRQGDAARAIAHYDTALRHEPDYPEALNNLGNALAQLGRHEEALARYAEAVKRRPSFAEAHNNLGNALLQAGRGEEAQAAFRTAGRLRPDNAETHYNLGNALAASGRMTEALVEFRAALAVRPAYAEAHTNAGNALLALNRPAEALAHYEQAIADSPNLPDAHFNLGTLLLQLDRPAEALPRFETALRLRPGFTAVHRPYGYALAVLGRRAEAITHYEAHLRANPGDAEARQELAQIRSGR
ncbi:MAG TPA: tetratricopeptide repeat protein [Opitutaceae bacterium]